MKIEGYPYLYETHLHTNQGSACAWNTGYEMAKVCHEAGYAGIIVTDHNWGGNTAVNRDLDWNEWVEQYAEGYRDALRYHHEHPEFSVFFGYEAGFWGTEFLIYGISPQWLTEHPEIRVASLEQHVTMVRKAGGMVIHAHPFRERNYIPEVRLFPELVDGVEGINATHSYAGTQDQLFNQRAIAYAAEHDFPMTAGSDVHSTRLMGGGMAFRRPLKSVEDFCQAVQSGEDYLLTDGKRVYDKKGTILK